MHKECLETKKYALENWEFLYLNEIFSAHNTQYPVVLEISNYASMNDVLDFVRKNWSNVKKERRKFDNTDQEFVVARSRVTWDKYDYIWKHKDVRPRSKLAEMVNKKFKVNHDAIYIRNTISNLKKERNK